MGGTVLTERRAALRVWSAFALLMLLVAAPVFSTTLPPLFDYPNHLARMHLLSEGGNQFYEVRWEPLPNLAQDLIVPPLARLVPLDVASKLFLVATLGLIAGATLWLNRVVTGMWRLWPLLAFTLLYNRVFLWGFLNYLFGIGIALFGAALWVALERKQWWLRAFTSTLVALACYFSHVAAFGFYALVIFGLELQAARVELRARCWPALGSRMVIAGVQFVAPAALFAGYWDKRAGTGVSYPAIWRKADLLFSVFDNYNRVFDIVCFASFLALLAWLAAARRLRLSPRLAWAVGAVAVVYLILPSQLYGGSGVDHRLPIALCLLVIGATAPEFPNRRIAAAIGVLTVVVLSARLAFIEHVWVEAGRVYSADLAGIDLLPRGARLAVAHPASAVNFVPIPEVHLPVLAVARREAFVPTLFAYKGQQPVALRPPYAALADAATPEALWDFLWRDDTAENAGLGRILQQYDFLVAIGNEPQRRVLSGCFQRIFTRPNFEILAVLHNSACDL
ncbi:MAG: hypothetical protein JO229_05280 [Alphaproteobacteria bacterium]|nr:hypothetical protein [Alphaproteobacteria bacterium]